MKNSFQEVAMTEGNPRYNQAISRKKDLYKRDHDLRSEFARDYTRIIFSQGYRRLKHKTQVFFAVDNDHICTRSEHVNLVESVSYTISAYLGLNTELTKAIAIGHDLGHAPFGHGGEQIISEIAKRNGLNKFWHEKNSLHFVDKIETLEDDYHCRHNLNLTYAVRDGIISHCGEMNQQAIKSRIEMINLDDYDFPGQYDPYTWEGCVVKMADKIAYLARDIEDALLLGLLKESQIFSLKQQIKEEVGIKLKAINNGVIVNYFIQDVCDNSSPEKGIYLSDAAFKIMKIIMKFNYRNIYLLKRLEIHAKYVRLILESIFDFYYAYYQVSKENGVNILMVLEQDRLKYPKTLSGYMHWLEKYARIDNINRPIEYQNEIIYNADIEKDIIKSIIDYLSGMSDAYILQIFNELVSF